MGLGIRLNMRAAFLLLLSAATVAGMSLTKTYYTDKACTKPLGVSLTFGKGCSTKLVNTKTYDNVTKTIKITATTGTMKSIKIEGSSCMPGKNITETYYSDTACKTKLSAAGMSNPRTKTLKKFECDSSGLKDNAGKTPYFEKDACDTSGSSSLAPAAV